MMRTPIDLVLENDKCFDFLVYINYSSKGIFSKKGQSDSLSRHEIYFYLKKFQNIIRRVCLRPESEWDKLVVFFTES